MKSKLKVVVVGNCQARPLAKLLKSLNPRISVTTTAIVHLLKNEQAAQYRPAFEEADLIVSQLVFDTYPCEFVRTNFLKERYGEKVISIVNLYFTGYTPDWFYIRIPGKGTLRGPMGDYHNRTILTSWQEGLSVHGAASRLRDPEYNQRYLAEVEKSLDQLRQRESLVDIKVVDIIEENFRKSRLFFTFNHPNMFLLREYAKRILQRAGIDAKRPRFVLRDRELLGQFIPLVNPAVELPAGKQTRHKGLAAEICPNKLVINRKKKKYTSEQMVKCFYSIYDELGEDLGLREIQVKG